MRHILSGSQFSRSDLDKILSSAVSMEKQCKSGKVKKALASKIVACMFFEPSTRTRLSFESAALRLGAGVISAENAAENSSAHKGETIEDTTKMVNGYADLIAIRHPEIGAVDRAAKVSKVPIINAGDGANQHPTQAVLDLYTIKKEQDTLQNLTIAFVGDLKYGRTLHSLLPLLSHYPNNKFYLVSPKELALPTESKKLLLNKKLKFEESTDLENVLKNSDVVYMTRVQKERFPSIKEYNKVKDAFLLKYEHLKLLKKSATIMHPLPRVNEIDTKIDQDPRAAYFREAQNGLYVRMALLLYALGL
jgi:aspartate carbamoyltransferase catalytic subunit